MSPSGTSKVTVRMWTSPLLAELRDFEVYSEFEKAFEREYPNIDVEVEMIPWQRRMEKIITAVAGDRAPDCAYMAMDFMPRLVELGALKPVNSYLTAEELADYHASVVDAVTLNGEMYLLPMDRSIVAAIYNKDLLQKAGLDPEKPPQTWDEVRTVAEKCTRDTDGDGQIDQWGFGYILGGESLNLTFWPLLWQAGGEVVTSDSKRVALTDLRDLKRCAL